MKPSPVQRFVMDQLRRDSFPAVPVTYIYRPSAKLAYVCTVHIEEGKYIVREASLNGVKQYLLDI